MITFAEFTKLDIRIGTIQEVSKVENADKLLKFIIDFGTEKRQIISGIATFFPNFATLVGKQVPVLVNLEPRMIRGQESQGMILVAEDHEKVILLKPTKKVSPGSVIR